MNTAEAPLLYSVGGVQLEGVRSVRCVVRFLTRCILEHLDLSPAMPVQPDYIEGISAPVVFAPFGAGARGEDADSCPLTGVNLVVDATKIAVVLVPVQNEIKVVPGHLPEERATVVAHEQALLVGDRSLVCVGNRERVVVEGSDTKG